jgi:hypothetical protein
LRISSSSLRLGTVGTGISASKEFMKSICLRTVRSDVVPMISSLRFFGGRFRSRTSSVWSTELEKRAPIAVQSRMMSVPRNAGEITQYPLDVVDDDNTSWTFV